jgi:hypothetical protein
MATRREILKTLAVAPFVDTDILKVTEVKRESKPEMYAPENFGLGAGLWVEVGNKSRGQATYFDDTHWAIEYVNGLRYITNIKPLIMAISTQEFLAEKVSLFRSDGKEYLMVGEKIAEVNLWCSKYVCLGDTVSFDVGDLRIEWQ